MAHSHRDWLALAYRTALQSHDPSTQNGAVLVDYSSHMIATACNQFPFNVHDRPERWQRPLKYEIIEHAERNAIYKAAFAGRATMLATLYCPWAACSDCARGIIQSGVKRLVRHADATARGAGRTWDDTISVADMMLREAGIEIVDVEGKVTEGLQVRHSGELWEP